MPDGATQSFLAWFFRRPGLLTLSPPRRAEGQPRRKSLKITGALAPEALGLCSGFANQDGGSPEKIAAFFDLDGTLLAPPSLEWRFIAFLLAREKMGGAEVARWLARCAANLLRDPLAATSGNQTYLTGLRDSLASDWEASLAPGSLPFFSAGVERIAWHLARGHRVFLVTGTLEPLARAAARRLPGPVEICATSLESRAGCWTGRIAGPHLRGEAKGRAVRALAARYGLSLWESYAYGNSAADLPMLDAVGRRFAVNPRAALRRIARRENWAVCTWKQSSGATPIAHPVQRLSGEPR